MPAPATIDDFLELVRKSNQVDPSRLDAYLERRRQDDTLPPDPKKFAALLVREGLLTNFQAEQLLQGRYKGFHLGGYRIIERLGAGGTGTVYLAEHEVMKRRVALKVVPPNVASDPGVLERFRREAQAAAVLDHPNIVRAYDFRQESRLYVLVMEYVNGPSLEQVLQSGGPLSVPVACEYARQAATGLEHAHEQGMVHRDIKPGNLLVDPTGVVKILDMGLARFSPEGQESLTKKFDENTVMGTADYLAPEQAINLHNVDTRADIYSLGATLYALLSGKPPFAEGTVTQKLLWHQMRDPTPLDDLRSDVPSEVAQVVERMMAKDPASRYQTCADVAEALAPFCATAPTPQGPARPGADNGRNTSAPYGRTGRVGPSTSARRKQAVRAEDVLDPPSSRTRLPEESSIRRRSVEVQLRPSRRDYDEDDHPRRRDDLPRPVANSSMYGILALVGVMLGVLLLVGGVILYLVIGSPPPVTSGVPVEEPQRPVVAPQPRVVTPVPIPAPAPSPVNQAAAFGELYRQDAAHLRGLERLAFAPDGVRLVTCAQDGTVKVWDTSQRRPIAELVGHTAEALSVTFVADGARVLSSAADKTARLWDVAGNRQDKVFHHAATRVSCAIIGRTENDLITAAGDNIIRLWNAAERKSIKPMAGHKGEVTGLAYRPGKGRNQVVSASFDQTLKVWDLDEGEEVQSLAGHKSIVSSVAVTHDGKFAVSGSHDATVKIWDLAKGANPHTLKAAGMGPVWAVAVSRDGRRAVSAGQDKLIRLWNLRNRKLERVFEGHADGVTGLAFTPDNKRFASCSLDRTFRVWSLPPLPK